MKIKDVLDLMGNQKIYVGVKDIKSGYWLAEYNNKIELYLNHTIKGIATYTDSGDGMILFYVNKDGYEHV